MEKNENENVSLYVTENYTVDLNQLAWVGREGAAVRLTLKGVTGDRVLHNTDSIHAETVYKDIVNHWHRLAVFEVN